MQEQEIKNYVLAQSEIEFPALQKEFSLSYSEAKSIIADLEKDGKLQYKSGVVYTVLSQPSECNNQSYYQPQNAFEAKCIDALWTCIIEGTASASFIQRRCLVGYAVAMNIIEWLEKNNYISSYPIRKPLISKEEYFNKFGKPSDCDDDGNKSSTPSELSGLYRTREELNAEADNDDDDDDDYVDDDDDDDDDDGIIDVDKEIAEFIRNIEGDDEFDVSDVASVLGENISRNLKKTPSGKLVLELNEPFDIWFEYMRESNVMRISDEGTAFIETSLSDRRIKNAIKKFPLVRYDNDSEKVFIDVPKPVDTFKAVLTLYSVLDYLFKLN